MANYTIHTITHAGAQLHAAALAEGKTIRFTHLSVGDGAAPAEPATAAALTAPLFNVPISTVLQDPAAPAQTIVRGSYVNEGAQSNFYQREIGIFAELSGDPPAAPILYAYFNAGETADYIPAVAEGSLIQQSLNLSVITGAAPVLYATDPLSPVTMADIADLQAKVARFDYYADHVKDLKIYTSIFDFSQDAPENVNTLFARMETNSLLIATVGPFSFLPEKEGHLSDGGQLIIYRGADGLGYAHFVDKSGTKYDIPLNGSPFSIAEWEEAGVDRPGRCCMFFGLTPPPGWLPCNGAQVSKAIYPRLYEAIGDTYGSTETSFNLPNMTASQFDRLKYYVKY